MERFRIGQDVQRKILFVTGTRADFGKLKPLMKRVELAPAFSCLIFATGIHLLARYGSTINEIHKAGFRNIFPCMNQDGGSCEMDTVLANTVQALGHYVREIQPDMIVVHGDRVETLAGAIVGALNNILVAHIEGGELSGTVDELIRHAVTKLSHLHFVSNEDARRRLVQMGELESSVFVIGSPDIDVMLSENLPGLEEAKNHYEIPFDKYALFAYHPVTTEDQRLGAHVSEVMEALKESGWDFVAIHPNNDRGAEIILEQLLPLQANPHFRIFPSIRFEYFLTLLRYACAIIGNSSAGIREAPVYGVPTINIGTRQRNRFRYPSIVDVAEDKTEIVEAMRRLPGRFAPSLHFGNGNSAEEFIGRLSRPELWQTPRQKQFQDVAFQVTG